MISELLKTLLTLEMLGSAFAILYLVLAIKQNIWCWAAGLISTGIFLFVFYEAKLYMETALQVFYIAMSCYGWWQWKHGGINNTELKIQTWSLQQHLLTISLILVLATVSGYLLNTYTDAAKPFIDSLTTWGAVVTTYMVARKVFENWHYWFVIDSISIYLYITRDLKVVATLFVIYLILVIFGYREWKRSLAQQSISAINNASE